MRYVVFLLCLVLGAGSLRAQSGAASTFRVHLQTGYPPEASFFVQQYGPTHLHYASLSTGVDSLRVYLGTFHHEESQEYYSIVVYKQKVSFRTFSLAASNPAPGRSQQISIPVPIPNAPPMSLAVHVTHEPLTNELAYTWMGTLGSSATASLQLASRLQLNAPMPDFTAQTLDGRPVTLRDFAGKYLILNWWNTGCGPCIAEMPVLNRIVQKYKDRSDVVFLAIAGDEQQRVAAFLAKHVFAYQQTYNKALTTLLGGTYPVHVMINPHGIITYYHEGVEMDLTGGEVRLQKQLAIEQAIEHQLSPERVH